MSRHPEAVVLSELLRGMARRASWLRRRESRAIRDRNRVSRESRLAIQHVATALGLTRVTHLSELRRAALELRAQNAELVVQRDRAQDALTDVLEERGDGHASAYAWLLTPVGGADLTEREAALAAEVTDLRGRLEQLRELNRGWARYGERVKARRDEGCPRCGRGRDDE